MHDVFLSFLSLHGIQVQQRIKEKEEGKWLSITYEKRKKKWDSRT
jgi:hypothetical protein